MTAQSLEIHRLTNQLAICHRYDPHVKADLFSTAIGTPAGALLIDPITAAAGALELVCESGRAAAIILTNENHTRASRAIAERFDIRIYADPAADVADALPLAELDAGSGLEIIDVPGAPAGEVALHHAQDGGTLIVGDALINFGSHGFDLLPAKYCANAKLMRRSLRKLLDYSFERMLFAHGTPICTSARNRLVTLLENGP
jgi:hypothetical protein